MKPVEIVLSRGGRGIRENGRGGKLNIVNMYGNVTVKPHASDNVELSSLFNKF
jgi:hypothetical protein